jgi:uncharacterized protein (DUF697 family)
MALPVKLGAVFGLLNEVGKSNDRPLLVGGALAETLARELAAGGEPGAIRHGGPPEDVEALVHVIGDTLTEEDERVLRLAHRARVPTVVVAAGRSVPERIPFVRATEIVRAEPGRGFPVEEIAKTLAHTLGEDATSLARRVPVLRQAVVERLISTFSRRNGIIGALVFVPGADLPVLTLNQLRMVLRICAAHGLDVDRRRIPEIAATVGAGFGFRAIARELLDLIPVAGWALRGAVAYTGTKAIGEASVRYCEAVGATPPQPASASPASS